MDVGQTLASNFPNTIRKDAEIFSALVANKDKTGTLERVINELLDFSQEWISTPGIYEQSGELLELTSNFFSYFERYTNETEEAFKNRIKTIFIRNEDTIWGGRADVLNVFRSLFPTGNIFLAENTGTVSENVGENENLIIDYDFEHSTQIDVWQGVTYDEADPCYYSRHARFNKGTGVVISDGGFISQLVEDLDVSSVNHFTQKDDTYKSLALFYYGDEELSNYIEEKNPDISEPFEIGQKIIIPKLNIFSLHHFLNGYCGVQIINNKNEYWNPEVAFDPETGKWSFGKWTTEEFTIEEDTVDTVTVYNDKGEVDEKKSAEKKEKYAQKATGVVYFHRKGTDNKPEIKIIGGTIIQDSDGHKFVTENDAIISSLDTESNAVAISSVKPGREYNVAANTITVIEDEEVSNLVTVTNTEALKDGTDFGWDDKNILIHAYDDITSLTVKFVGLDKGIGFIDYVRMFPKGNYPSFTVIAQFTSYAQKNAAALFPGQEDEEITTAHENASYYDNDYLTGVITGGYALDLYLDILNYIKATGVKAHIEILNRDE